MKKILIVLCLFTSMFMNSQNYNVTKLTVGFDFPTNICNDTCKNLVIGFDAGEIIENRYYMMIDFGMNISYNKKYDNPIYLNLGAGPMISNNTYIIGLIGVYSSHEMPIRFNLGAEFGIINKNVITSIYLTNSTDFTSRMNVIAGFKIGYRFNEID